MKYEFVLTRDDYAQLFAAWFQSAENEPAWKQFRRDNKLLLGLCVGGTVGVLFMFFAGKQTSLASWIPYLCAIIVAQLWHFWWKRNRYSNSIGTQERIRESVESASTQYHVGPASVEFRAHGFRWQTRHEVVLQQWSGIASVTERGGFYVVARHDGQNWCIPHRVIGDKQACAEFFAQTQKWLSSFGQSDDARIIAYCAGQDVDCPSCKYNLKDVSQPRCPECGVQLAKHNMSGAFL